MNLQLALSRHLEIFENAKKEKFVETKDAIVSRGKISGIKDTM